MGLPAAVDKYLGRLETRLVHHLLAAGDEIAQIEPWQVLFCRLSQKIKNHIGAERARRLGWVEEGIDRAQPVILDICQDAAH